MKKLIHVLVALLIAIVPSMAQAQGCTPASTLSINTGLSASGALVSPGAPDPLWGGFTIPNLPGSMAQWNNMAGTRILSPGPSNSVAGTQTFRRNFSLCREALVKFNGAYRDDNMLVSLKIKDGSAATKWSSAVPSSNPQCFADNAFSGSASLLAGDYYLEFIYNNQSSYGGFALSGTLTTTDAVLANSKACCPSPCATCDLFNSRPEIHGPTTIKCDSPARFFLTNCPDVTYTWTVTPSVPFTGQGTSSITLTPPFTASDYRINVVIKCGDKQTTAGYGVKVEKKDCCSPAFMASTEEVSATGYRVTGIPSVPTLGCRHYWLLTQISNCGSTGVTGMSGWGLAFNAWGYAMPQPNPAITPAGPNNNGYTYGGLAKGQCYTLTHYVVCCGEWKYVPKCVCMANLAKIAQTGGDEQIRTIEYKDLPKAVRDMHEKALQGQ